jgi:hypothetical protein
MEGSILLFLHIMSSDLCKHTCRIQHAETVPRNCLVSGQVHLVQHVRGEAYPHPTHSDVVQAHHD